MSRASRGGIGKISAAVVVVAMVAMVVGVGGFFASQGPPVTMSPQTASSTGQTSSRTNQPSSVSSASEPACTKSGAVDENASSSSPPCGCALVVSNSNGSLYVSPHPRVGDNVCVEASLNYSAQVSFSITDSAGSTVFSGTCISTAPPGAPPPTRGMCTAFWNTANPDPQRNAVEPGTYLLVARGSSGAVQLGANFTLH